MSGGGQPARRRQRAPDWQQQAAPIPGCLKPLEARSQRFRAGRLTCWASERGVVPAAGPPVGLLGASVLMEARLGNLECDATLAAPKDAPRVRAPAPR